MIMLIYNAQTANTHTDALNAADVYGPGFSFFFFILGYALIYALFLGCFFYMYHYQCFQCFFNIQCKLKLGKWGSLLLGAHTVFSEHSLLKEE